MWQNSSTRSKTSVRAPLPVSFHEPAIKTGCEFQNAPRPPRLHRRGQFIQGRADCQGKPVEPVFFKGIQGEIQFPGRGRFSRRHAAPPSRDPPRANIRRRGKVEIFETLYYSILLRFCLEPALSSGKEKHEDRTISRRYPATPYPRSERPNGLLLPGMP